MELPLPRPFGTEGGRGGGGGRKPTHDFLSLYSHSTIPQDPRPPSQPGHLKTHDFLKPLERVGQTSAKEETNEISMVEKSPPLAPPTSVEHILVGGTGTYSISHISYFNNQVSPKPEGAMFTVAQSSSSDYKNEESSNCSSYTTGNGFTLWEESVMKKGKNGKENVGERSSAVREVVAMTGLGASDRPSQLSSNNRRNSFSSLSSSSQPSPQKSQSFVDIIKSAKGSILDNDIDDEEEIVLKKESPSPVHKAIGELRVKVNEKSTDQKANTPRSKHSATEQRRRSKINDRFQMLRELIPHSDQKRDKASFLSEVIEYIQFLQEKVQKYEGSYQGWNQDPAKMVTWNNNSMPGESYLDQSRGISNGIGPGLNFPGTLDDKTVTLSPIVPGNAKNLVESDMNSATASKAMDQHLGMKNTAMLFPMSLPPNFFRPGRTVSAAAQFAHTMTSDNENMANQPLAPSHLTRLGATDALLANDKLKEQDLTIEGGTISISSVYSQGLLNTLTQVLHNSGVDLSQASISVQIELGKQETGRPVAQRSIVKDNQKATRSRNSSGEESDPALKKLKTITS